MTWVACVLEAVLLLLVLIFGSDAGAQLLATLAIIGGAAVALALWAVRVLLFALSSRGQPWKRFRVWAVEPLLIAIVFAVFASGALFWPRFFLSLPALGSYARTVRQGPPIESGQGRHSPRLVGLFLVRETEALPNGVVRIITTSCGFNDCGLTYSPTATKPPRIGEDVYDRLTLGWWRWWRSW
jgi:hypothetical protein